MVTLSVCMIVKDEEDTLGRCLESIKEVADEIVIVDTGSTDKTKEIASKYTDKIYDFEWVDDFSKARNYSFSKASMQYTMWMDADDVLLKENQNKLLELKKELDPQTDTVIMKYDLTDRKTQKVVCSFYRERIVKTENNYKWQDPVHEFIAYDGKVIKSDIALTHKKIHPPTKRNLEIFEKYIKDGNELSERNWFYYARELFSSGQKEKAAKYYNMFLETTGAVISNYIDACVELSSYYDDKEDDINSLKTLIRFFEKDGPRAEIICKIGYYYKNRKEYKKAIDWFGLAPNCPVPVTYGAVIPKYWDYIPYVEMCACSYKMGDIDNAIEYNELASKKYPDDNLIIYNRCYLGTIKRKLVNGDMTKEEVLKKVNEIEKNK